MSNNNNKCPHVDIVPPISLSELYKVKQGLPCTQCSTIGQNLWICLYKSCQHIGCSEEYNDHSTKHFRTNQTHCLHMNLSTQRIWCYVCKAEVFIASTAAANKRRVSLISNDSGDSSSHRRYVAAGDSSDEDLSGGDYRATSSTSSMDAVNGLVGLQNIANTCYMNAALQALSNIPPLTGYFLDCGDIIEAKHDQQQQQQYYQQSSSAASQQRKVGLARSYHRLVKEMWCRTSRSYVVPNGILNGIRSVHPMFRGYLQHDTQEFLRCFMDQLHEELKEVTPPPPDSLLRLHQNIVGSHKYLPYKDNNVTTTLFNSNTSAQSDDDDETTPSHYSSSPTHSEAEYETCDSGMSESSCDEHAPRRSRYQGLHSNNNNNNNVKHYPTTPNITSTTAPTTYQRHQTNQVVSDGSSERKDSNDNNKTDGTAAEKKSLPHRSIISDVFDGKLLSSVQCLTCNRVSTREETFQDLSLPIPGKDHLTVLHQNQSGSHHSIPVYPQQQQQQGVTCTDAVYTRAQDSWFWWVMNWVRSFFYGPAVSLHDCMAAFFSADELKGDNMYSCEKCKKLRNGIKYSRVLQLPEMLCVHLKRFRHDLSYSSKITSPVHFPMTDLDMSTFLHKDCRSDISTYDLTAVICHHGTVGGGHYTSYARHESNGKWYEYDDQLITKVSEEAVQNCEAYVLFYRKVNPKMADIRTYAIQLSDMCLANSSVSSTDICFYVSKQWLNRFYTFAEPGPIDNWAMLCPHGAFSPAKTPIKSRLVVSLAQPLWEYLYRQFGGGPVCNHLYECDTCRREAEALVRRQTGELDSFQRYKDETTTRIYAISMVWFRQWQLFVGGGDDPGPINNVSIAGGPDVPVRTVRSGSDYAQINSALWKFFYGVYGGGPVILLCGELGDSDEDNANDADDDDAATASAVIDDGGDVDETIKEMVEEVVKEPEMYIPIIDAGDSKALKDVADETTMITNGPSTEISTATSEERKIKKVVKNVSFEDESEQLDNSSIASSTMSSETLSGGGVGIFSSTKPTLKRSKHSSVTATINVKSAEIVNKKDKRHRGGITTNGLFGPEGKYSGNSMTIDDGHHSPDSRNLDDAQLTSTATTDVDDSAETTNTTETVGKHKSRKKQKSAKIHTKKHHHHHHNTNYHQTNHTIGDDDCDLN